jgi:hypothetical protein
VCEAASTSGGKILLQVKVPLAKKPRERNSRLNKTDQADNFLLTLDIKE